MSIQAKAASANKKLAKKNIILIVLVIAIAVIPLFIQKSAKFAGSDDKAREAISEIKAGYKPWFTPIWKPPSGEIESLLFSLQASIGSLIIGYYIGYVRGRKRKEETDVIHR